jgi:hypothetical protein
MNNTVVETKYKNVVITPISHPVFQEMVHITKTPKNKSVLMGKKYVTLSKAIIAVDNLIAEAMIASGGKKVKEELMELGLAVEE